MKHSFTTNKFIRSGITGALDGHEPADEAQSTSEELTYPESDFEIDKLREKLIAC